MLDVREAWIRLENRRLRSFVLLAALSLACCGGAHGFLTEDPAAGLTCDCPEGLSVECYEAVVRNSMSITNCLCRSDSQPVPVPCIGAGEDSVPLNTDLLNPTDECACNKMREPQCDSTGVEKASNNCIRDCLGYSKTEVNMWYCAEIPNDFFDDYFADWDEEDIPADARQVGCRASCNLGDTPIDAVCDAHGTEVASSACLAECNGYQPADFSTDYCAHGYRDSVLCKCAVPTEDEYVCTDKGIHVADSPCIAECLGYSLEDVTSANCNAGRPPCLCALLWAPLCDDKGTPMASNTCEHTCMYGDTEGQEFVEDNCQQTRHDNAACGCEGAEEEPMCDTLGTVVAPNSCVAECAGYTTAVLCGSPIVPFTAPKQEGGSTEGGNGEGGNEEVGNEEGGNGEGGNEEVGNEEGGNQEGGNEEVGNEEGSNEDVGNEQGGNVDGSNQGGGNEDGGDGRGDDSPVDGQPVPGAGEPEDSHAARQNLPLFAQGLLAALCLLGMLAT